MCSADNLRAAITERFVVIPMVQFVASISRSSTRETRASSVGIPCWQCIFLAGFRQVLVAVTKREAGFEAGSQGAGINSLNVHFARESSFPGKFEYPRGWTRRCYNMPGIGPQQQPTSSIAPKDGIRRRTMGFLCYIKKAEYEQSATPPNGLHGRYHRPDDRECRRPAHHTGFRSAQVSHRSIRAKPLRGTPILGIVAAP